MSDSIMEKRKEPRVQVNQYFSVDFSTGDDPCIYQFKIWNISAKGMCLIVKEGSSALRHLKVGELLSMRYFSEDSPALGEYRKTRIVHVTREDCGQFIGHCLVGISILEDGPP
jgi:hypothetical protein